MPKSLINGGSERRPSRVLDVWESDQWITSWVNLRRYHPVSECVPWRVATPLALTVRTNGDKAAAGEADGHGFSKTNIRLPYARTPSLGKLLSTKEAHFRCLCVHQIDISSPRSITVIKKYREWFSKTIWDLNLIIKIYFVPFEVIPSHCDALLPTFFSNPRNTVLNSFP